MTALIMLSYSFLNMRAKKFNFGKSMQNVPCFDLCCIPVSYYGIKQKRTYYARPIARRNIHDKFLSLPWTLY